MKFYIIDFKGFFKLAWQLLLKWYVTLILMPEASVAGCSEIRTINSTNFLAVDFPPLFFCFWVEP